MLCFSLINPSFVIGVSASTLTMDKERHHTSAPHQPIRLFLLSLLSGFSRRPGPRLGCSCPLAQHAPLESIWPRLAPTQHWMVCEVISPSCIHPALSLLCSAAYSHMLFPRKLTSKLWGRIKARIHL